MIARLRRSVRKAIERGLGVYGYRIVNPAHRYGIDHRADIARIAKAWGIAVTVIFDVGANVGAASRAYRATWRGAEIRAFEPDETVAAVLRRNLASMPDVTIEPLALGDAGGRSEFHVYADMPVLNSLAAKSPYVERHGLQGVVTSVDVATLDDYCARHAIERISVLKIDTEGADHKVLLGARRLLGERRIDFVYCEFNTLDADPERLGSLMPIAALLSGHGYRFVASYNDYILTDGAFFAVSNALFAAEPRAG